MLKILCSSILAAMSLSAVSFGPQTPVNITMDESVLSPVTVAGTTNGFLTAWRENGTNNVMTSFSSDLGATWSTPVSAGSDCSYTVFAAAKGTRFVLTWIDTDVGYNLGNVVASYSDDNGSTWSTPVVVSPAFMDPGGSANPPSVIAANSSGFMVVWTAGNGMGGHLVWESFSSDGATWSTPEQVSPDLLYNPYNYISVGANGAGFLISWIHYDNDTSQYVAYTSFSNDSGSSWSTPALFPEDADFLNTYCPVVCGVNDGFMLAWIDATGIPYSSFTTTNGSAWSTKSLISPDQASDVINATASTGGIIAAWQGSVADGLASISSNQGSAWASASTIVPADGIQIDFLSGLSVASVGQNTLFAWWSSDYNAMASYSPTPSPASSTTSDNGSTLYPQITPNRPDRGLFGR